MEIWEWIFVVLILSEIVLILFRGIVHRRPSGARATRRGEAAADFSRPRGIGSDRS